MEKNSVEVGLSKLNIIIPEISNPDESIISIILPAYLVLIICGLIRAKVQLVPMEKS